MPDYVAIFISKIGFPKFLPLMWFISFSLDSAMSRIMVNVLGT